MPEKSFLTLFWWTHFTAYFIQVYQSHRILTGYVPCSRLQQFQPHFCIIVMGNNLVGGVCNIFQEEYEAARAELLEEMGRGTSIKELRVKLTKKPDAEEDSMKRSPSTEGEIPNDLVQVQAYIRWEKAGKPNYSPEEQIVMLYTTYTLTVS